MSIFHVNCGFVPYHCLGLEVNFDAEFAQDIMANDHVMLMWRFHSITLLSWNL